MVCVKKNQYKQGAYSVRSVFILYALCHRWQMIIFSHDIFSTSFKGRLLELITMTSAWNDQFFTLRQTSCNSITTIAHKCPENVDNIDLYVLSKIWPNASVCTICHTSIIQLESCEIHKKKHTARRSNYAVFCCSQIVVFFKIHCAHTQ